MKQVFDAYSAYYDLIYDGKDYAAETNYVIGLIKEYAPAAKNLMELGSGTGGHARHFAQNQFDVFGIDLSKTMLKRAEDRRETYPADLRPKLQFAHGDVRSFRCGQKFDAAISLFHVMSYQTTNADLEAAFATAAAHLQPGGIFIFDYWFAPAVLAQKPEVRVRTMENSEIYAERTATPVIHLDKKYVEVHFAVTIHSKRDDSKQALNEQHDMRYFDLAEIETVAAKYFEVRGHFGWMKDNAPTPEDWGALTILERKA